MKRYTLINIFKPAYGDCSNRGVSNKFADVAIVMPDDVIAAKDSDIMPNDVVIIKDICQGEERLRAIPAIAWKKQTWTMFGGCAIYTSNGIVPYSGKFIPLHDRIEGA